MSQLEILLDNGDGGLCAEMSDEFERMGVRVIGQDNRRIGSPMLILETNARDDIAAEMTARRILTHYNATRLAA